MKEGFFVLFVILVLLGLTAVRYRKQISGMIGFARALKDAKEAAGHGRIGSQPAGVQLVHCGKCGVWIPENKAIRRGAEYYCIDCG